jgi:hypothetical protein
MFLELNREELALLVKLVEERIHSDRWNETKCETLAIPTYHCGRESGNLERLLHKLHSCDCDVFA